MTEEEFGEGKELLFENDHYEFFEVLTHEVAVYYGGATIFGRDSFKNQFRYGSLYMLINKLEHDSSFWLHIDDQGRTDIENFEGETLKLTNVLQEYPFIEKFIEDSVRWFSQGTYLGLKALASGTKPRSEWEIEQMDPLIDDVKLATKNPKNSILFLKFDTNEDYFKTFDFSEDTMWILRIIFDSYGSGYDFLDYSDDYDWREGRVLYNFDGENKQKLEDILKVLAPTLSIINNDNEYEQAVQIFDSVYPRFGENVWDDYVSNENQARNEAFKKEVRDDLCDIYQKFGIYKKQGCFWKYIVSVASVLRLYEKTKRYDLDLYELIQSIGKDLSVTDYGEYMYEVYGDFDVEGFNRSVSYYVDDFYNKVMEGDLVKDINEFKKITTELQKKYRFQNWYNFPADEKLRFNIQGVDPQTNKLIVDFRMGHREGTGRSNISYEDFMNKITNMSLF